MATVCCSATIALAASRVPRPFTGLSDITPLWEASSCLSGMSRKDWCGSTLRKLVADYRLASLEYLYATATCLSPGQVAAAADDLQGVLRRWRAEPGEPRRLTGQDYPVEADIPAFLDAPATLDPASESDDGDDVPYLISYLKGHLQVLVSARDAGLCVVHANSV